MKKQNQHKYSLLYSLHTGNTEHFKQCNTTFYNLLMSFKQKFILITAAGFYSKSKEISVTKTIFFSTPVKECYQLSVK